jgi:REP element-mobilizing transposase RayT
MHTYTSIYLHVVFATWSRRPFLAAALRSQVHAYLAATARNLRVADVRVGGYDDHVHLLGDFNPAKSPSAVIGELKQAATHWLRQDHIRDFQWQRGFSAFAVSRNRVSAVARYIEHQEEHHRVRTFPEELEELLREHGVSIDDVHLL